MLLQASPTVTSAVLCVLAAFSFSATAQVPDASGPTDVSELSLEDLLNHPIAVASQKPQTVRETPAVVTRITRAEISGSGARDLIDVLWLVPGFVPAVDVEGVVDMGFRGIWAHEGKILLMIDGLPMNDLLYNNNELGHHFPVALIEAVEIIRGPGSVKYGGWAELAVINIITRSPADLKGATAIATYGQMTRGLGQADLSLAVAESKAAGIEGLNVSLSGFLGAGNRSDQTYSDFESPPSSFSMLGNSQVNPGMVNLGVEFRGLQFRLLYDDYRTTERDGYGTDNRAPLSNELGPTLRFRTLTADLSYHWMLGNLELTPRLTYSVQAPWQIVDPLVTEYFDDRASRLDGRLTGVYRFSDSFQATAGAEAFVDTAWVNLNVTGNPANEFLGQNTIAFINFAGFAEAQYTGLIGNITAGIRAEYHNLLGSSAGFVNAPGRLDYTSVLPRLAYTRTFGSFHFKALYSYAFRAPGIEDIALASPAAPVRPERTRVIEAEVGYAFGEHYFLSVNAFDIDVLDPIVYGYDVISQAQVYLNYPRTGSQGVEVDFRIRHSWGYVNANYSYYSSYSLFEGRSKNEVPLYSVPGTDTSQGAPLGPNVSPSLLLGLPAHKITVSGRWNVWRGLGIAPSAIWISSRWGTTTADSNNPGLGTIGSVPPALLLNLFVSYRDLFVPGLELGVAVYNALNTGFSYLQPYDANHPPLPGPSREILVRLAYALGF